MKKILTINLLLVCIIFTTQAQVIQDFGLVNAKDEKTVSLKDFSKSEALVVIFTSNNCPYDGYYLDRIKSLQSENSTRVSYVLVNSHVDENESIAAMKSFAAKNNFSVPYLADKDQTLMNALGARKSPEAFVLQNTNGQFKVVYRGAIDDNAQSSADVKTNFLKNSINQLLTGQKPETSEERPVGCSIRKK